MSTRELDRLLEDAVNQLKSSGVPTDARSGRVKDSAMDVVEEYILDKYGDNNSKGFKDGLLSAFKPIVRKHSVKLVAELLEQKQTNREWKMEGTQFSDRAREWTLSTAKAAMKKYEEVTKAGADADADADDGPDALAVTVLVKSVRTIVLLLLHASKAVASKSSALARNTEKLFASDRPVAIFRFALLDLEYTVTYAQLLNTLKKSVVETDVRVTPSGKVYCPVKCCVNSQGRKKFSSLKAIRTHFESRSCAAYAVLEKHHYYLETRPAKPRNKGGKEVGLKRDRNSVSGLARANQTSMKRHVVASPRGQPAKRQKTNGGEARPSHSRRAVSVSSSDSEESSDAQSSSGDGGHPASPARQEGSGRRTMTDAERRILYDEIQPADELMMKTISANIAAENAELRRQLTRKQNAEKKLFIDNVVIPAKHLSTLEQGAYAVVSKHADGRAPRGRRFEGSHMKEFFAVFMAQFGKQAVASLHCNFPKQVPGVRSVIYTRMELLKSKGLDEISFGFCLERLQTILDATGVTPQPCSLMTDATTLREGIEIYQGHLIGVTPTTFDANCLQLDAETVGDAVELFRTVKGIKTATKVLLTILVTADGSRKIPIYMDLFGDKTATMAAAHRRMIEEALLHLGYSPLAWTTDGAAFEVAAFLHYQLRELPTTTNSTMGPCATLLLQQYEAAGLALPGIPTVEEFDGEQAEVTAGAQDGVHLLFRVVRQACEPIEVNRGGVSVKVDKVVRLHGCEVNGRELLRRGAAKFGHQILASYKRQNYRGAKLVCSEQFCSHLATKVENDGEKALVVFFFLAGKAVDALHNGVRVEENAQRTTDSDTNIPVSFPPCQTDTAAAARITELFALVLMWTRLIVALAGDNARHIVSRPTQVGFEMLFYSYICMIAKARALGITQLCIAILSSQYCEGFFGQMRTCGTNSNPTAAEFLAESSLNY